LWRGRLNGGRRKALRVKNPLPKRLKAAWGLPEASVWGCIGCLRGRSREAPPAAGNNPNLPQVL
jgi:hypothetical protein